MAGQILWFETLIIYIVLYFYKLLQPYLPNNHRNNLLNNNRNNGSVADDVNILVEYSNGVYAFLL